MPLALASHRLPAAALLWVSLLPAPAAYATALYPQASNWEGAEAAPGLALPGAGAPGKEVMLTLDDASVSVADTVEDFLKALPEMEVELPANSGDRTSVLMPSGDNRAVAPFDRWLYSVADVIKDTPEAREYLGTLKREVVTPLRSHLVRFEGEPLATGSSPLRPAGPSTPDTPRAAPGSGGDDGAIRDWIARLTQPSSLILMATLLGLGMLAQRLRERFREKRQARRDANVR